MGWAASVTPQRDSQALGCGLWVGRSTPLDGTLRLLAAAGDPRGPRPAGSSMRSKAQSSQAEACLLARPWSCPPLALVLPTPMALLLPPMVLLHSLRVLGRGSPPVTLALAFCPSSQADQPWKAPVPLICSSVMVVERFLENLAHHLRVTLPRGKAPSTPTPGASLTGSLRRCRRGLSRAGEGWKGPPTACPWSSSVAQPPREERGRVVTTEVRSPTLRGPWGTRSGALPGPVLWPGGPSPPLSADAQGPQPCRRLPSRWSDL